MEFFSHYYLGIKCVHIVAIVCWMAMLFYLPRLFVYHAENSYNSEFVRVVKLQEKRLYIYIGLPALVLTILSGAALILADPQVFAGGWLHAKLLLVILLVAYHFSCGVFIRTLGNRSCNKSGKFFRIYNEIPTLFLILIVILAVLKPF
ncbi:MAG: protoporphyrinogen oxidase HemJ [Helicobacter sp.]|uniref:protoporphyrinogen oxidase HemJ n=1 Tax=Helicobacter sp. 10-6591 TaxID=2004998 RepID=UPI000DCF40D7|nr:protoporphyrinogen oxidase HemJ [Helicobacter sp. 10-6591]MCI6218295.1 protoporphyrinogen oxidase HemJ [Helicobacter sp.]MCI7485143.1 protoporphyrinogen oxidase HemJ [Helicobacter sp.]MDD7566885.1 protoporphyrinogen oxidase HemJ [Helicobacter sp.]MDY5740696.1 protoporphyrinogen oxidase HemJ [Helicobacter sp.]RAX53922.1 TIGR00701 family protein [Helicobacter sp. 10-6591]